jgi:hypothetical protein
MGLLDSIFDGGGGGGLLDFLRNNALNQQFPSGLPSDQAQYGQPPLQSPQFAPVMAQQSAPSSPQARAPSSYGLMPQANAQTIPQPPPPILPPPQMAAPAPQAQPQPSGVQPFQMSRPNPWLGNDDSFLNRVMGNDPTSQALAQQQYNQKAMIAGLRAKGVSDSDIMMGLANPEALKTLVDENLKTKTPMNLGNGQVLFPGAKTATKLYEPEDRTPASVLEYKYYRDNLPKGQQPIPYDVWSTAKARAGATSIANSIDMNSGQTYDKQLAEGLGKSHASLANGVEDAQTRARDIAAMQGAVDAIQKNNGSTGGLAPAQRLELQKSINAGASAIGIDKPFSESDLADKEFLTKFNRSMAGAQAKNSVGSRVTNFEMGNFLKANPGLDMTLTGNQRLLGIQAQIEQRNIAVGNQIRDATAEAISQGKKIDPVTVQKIVSGYDQEHHIKDVVTGQDLTQSYALPEFQKGATNSSMATAHSENIKSMEKTIGGKTYVQKPDGEWYVKK